MQKLRKGDKVMVIAGKDRGRTSVIKRIVSPTRVIVEGVQMIKRHVRANPNKNEQGGIIEREATINISNVAICNPTTNKADKVGFKVVDGRKIRIYKSNQEQIDI